jgi:membrane protein
MQDNKTIIRSHLVVISPKKHQKVIKFLMELLKEFDDDGCWGMSASLAYYTAFSLAPLLVLLISFAGVFFDVATIRGEIYLQINNFIGEHAATVIAGLLENATLNANSTIGWVISVFTALLGASTAFSFLHNSLNKIWQVYSTEKSPLAVLKQRLLTFLLLLGLGTLLVGLLIFNTVADFAYSHFVEVFKTEPSFLLKLSHSLSSFFFMTLLFALIFRILSDIDLRWKDTLAGAALTTGLFILGRWGISFYLAQSNISSVYGAAGSLALLLTWFYYSAVILFLGAEFIKVFMRYQDDTFEKKKRKFTVKLPKPHTV